MKGISVATDASGGMHVSLEKVAERRAAQLLITEVVEGKRSRAALDVYFATIERREHEVKAFCYLDIESCRATSAQSAGPLAGLPVAVKDLFDTADMPTSYGSPIYADWRPPNDAPLVTMIKRAGGAIIGKTVTTEFAYTTSGPTRNPHHLGHTPGGSSSGSAAAVAAGMVPFAIGTQTAGSVIRPAAFCGIAGYKPTFGALPTSDAKTFSWSLDTAGLFAPSVESVALFASALFGIDWKFASSGFLGQTRFGLLKTPYWKDASPDMRQAVLMAAQAARATGTEVREVQLDADVLTAFQAHSVIQAYEGVRALGYEFINHRSKLSSALVKHLQEGSQISGETYAAAQAGARRARQAIRNLFEEVDVLLTPSAPGSAPAGLEFTGSALFNRVWTLLGLPCVNVPGFNDAAGLPLGVQVVAPAWSDKQALQAAALLETAIVENASP